MCGFLIFSVSYAYEPVITQTVRGQDELNCKEVVFISGKPITLEGTAEISISKSGKSQTESYSYNLQDGAGNTLTRELSFNVTSEEKSNGQITKVWEVEDFQELLNRFPLVRPKDFISEAWVWNVVDLLAYK